MPAHIVPIVVVVSALVRSATCAPAADEFHGTVVSASYSQLTMNDVDGRTQRTFDIAADAVINRDGYEARLDELKPGDLVLVITEFRGGRLWATAIIAQSVPRQEINRVGHKVLPRLDRRD